MKLDTIQKKYEELFYLQDKALIPLLLAVVLGARLKCPPVWMYLIGSSSGGKSTILSIFNKIGYVTVVGKLTANTFLSGAVNNQEETSLLKKLGNKFVLIFKDFTTILSSADETQQALIGDMREIYDGFIRKDTGTGRTIIWGEKDNPWKSIMLMACTEAIYKVQEKFSDMGTRAVSYVLIENEEDRRPMTRASLAHNSDFNTKMNEIQDTVNEFITQFSEDTVLPKLPEELIEEIIDIADFSSVCRSIVLRDYRGVMSLALSPEAPSRIAKQLQALIQLLMVINGGELDKTHLKAVYKSALDSIPKQTRLALFSLARHYQVTEGGVAKEIYYPKERTKEWLENLHMFKVVDRVKRGKKEFWQMQPKFRDVMIKYYGVEMDNEILRGDDDLDDDNWNSYDRT